MKLLILLLLLVTHTLAASDSIHMGEISSLTFHKNTLTTTRRTDPVPQLACVGGTAENSGYIPPTVQCMNKGFNGESYDWSCVSFMDENYKIGSVHVVCEGYNGSGDLNITKGSCSLEFELNYTYRSTGSGNNIILIIVLIILALNGLSG